MNNITFVIFTYNEEKRISYVIKNFIKYGDVCIFDGGSTDKTKEITESLGAKFFSRPPSDGQQSETEENFEFIKTKIKTDWIYCGFADNMLPKTLLDKVFQIVKEKKYKYIRVPLYSYLYGMMKYPMLKSYNPMFFMIDYVDFSNNIIHGMGKFTGEKKEIITLPSCDKYAARHYSLYDLDKFVFNHLRYANEEAQSKFKRGVKFRTWLMLAAMLRYFVLYYKYSFKCGVRGLIMALSYANFRMMTYAKLYEIEQGIDLQSIESDFIKNGKEKILKEIK